MRKQNVTLMALCVALAVFNIILFFGGDSSFGTVDTKRFAALDTASFSTISFLKGDQRVVLERDGSWKVSGEQADGALLRILMAVLSKVEVNKEVGGELRSTLIEKVEVDGVQLYINEGYQYTIVGNDNLTKTYFIDEEQTVFEVGIPGYNDFIASIYGLSSLQWRDRTIFNGSVRTIQSLSLDFNEGSNLDIEFSGNFFHIDQVNEVDTVKLENYLNQFIRLQANERIDLSAFPKYDSLSKTTPLVTLKVSNLIGEQLNVTIFPVLDSDKFHLMVSEEGDSFAFDTRRIGQLLRRPDYFTYQN